MKLIRPLSALAVLAMTGAMTACAADVYPPSVDGYATVSVDTVPPDIYTYPHVAYEGSNAYLVNDTWYYPSARGWVKLRHESPTLARYRAARRPAPPRTEEARPEEVRRGEPDRAPAASPAPPGYAYPRPR